MKPHFTPPHHSIQVNSLLRLFPHLMMGTVTERAKKAQDRGDGDLLILPRVDAVASSASANYYGEACVQGMHALNWHLSQYHNRKLYFDRSFESHFLRLKPRPELQAPLNDICIEQDFEDLLVLNVHAGENYYGCDGPTVLSSIQEDEFPLGFFEGLMMFIADPNMPSKMYEGEEIIYNFPGSVVKIDGDEQTAFFRQDHMLRFGLRALLGSKSQVYATAKRASVLV